ncbi:MAG: hypothetical protein H6605_07630 [Flavobacteriales bacterium]|nr:hypothetical protein [Flavobacteriales bacterium]
MKSGFKLIFLTGLFSCNLMVNKSEPDGGPCSYLRDTLPVEVIGIEQIGDSLYDLRLVVKRGEDAAFESDSFSIYQMLNRFVSKNEMDNLSIKKGTYLSQEVMDITSGSCNDHIENFLLKPFTKKSSEK